ncbi:hypothetical protein BACCIP111899_02843 [Bacillus rhizoplanae]|uniref:Uncharacterized protein n=1 Tax=Bacillus rhizoplanae TaxID=2880966 RepID=A0ABM8YD76_9BACI|nr:hypothetical protein BACCIP111899_02843 [Bacillus rhizoplanae]
MGNEDVKMVMVLFSILLMFLGLFCLWMSIFGKKKMLVRRIFLFFLGIGIEIVAIYLLDFYLFFQL